MKNLFKYELRKTLASKIILLVFAVLIEVFFLVTLSQQKPTQLAIAFVAFVALGGFGIMFVGIQSLLTLHRDMNTRQGYMLFMTPNSSYKILGAKVLENACSTLIIGAIFFAVGMMDVKMIRTQNGSLMETLALLKDLISGFTTSFSYSFEDVSFFVVDMILNWLSTITLAYFADIMISSVLNGKKFSALLGFALFLLLTFIENKIGSLLPKGNTLAVRCIISLVFYGVITVATYFGSAKLMDRHLSI